SLEGYEAAGTWITYLADRYGWDSVRQLHQRAVPGIAAADFEREFARIYPISMDEAWSAALDTPDARPCPDDWRCMAAPLAVGENGPVACDGEMHRSIAVGDQGGIALAFSRSFADVVLRDCENPASPRYRLEGGPTDPATHFATLPPGTYTLFAGYGLTDVTFAAYLSPGFDGDRCDTAGGITLDHAQAGTIDLLPGQTGGWIPIA